MEPDKDTHPEVIEVTPAMIEAGLKVADRYNDDFQPGIIPERALAAVYIAMRRLEASCANSTS